MPVASPAVSVAIRAAAALALVGLSQPAGAAPPASCAEGMVQTNGQCCWAGQTWDAGKFMCVGRPQCPADRARTRWEAGSNSEWQDWDAGIQEWCGLPDTEAGGVIPATYVGRGSFLMGQGWIREQWVHPVHLTRGFYMMRRELTYADFNRLTGESRRNDALDLQDGWDGGQRDQGVQEFKVRFMRETYPDRSAFPIPLSFSEAARVANALSERDSLERCYYISGTEVRWDDRLCKGWRLPTEAEWEWAAREGTATVQVKRESDGRNHGDLPCATNAQFVSARNRWSAQSWSSSRGSITAVSFGHARPYESSSRGFLEGYGAGVQAGGLVGLVGNMYEWVWDENSTFVVGRAEIDPVHETDSWDPDHGKTRVAKGGEAASELEHCNPSARIFDAAEDPNWEIGARFVRLDPTPWSRAEAEADAKGAAATRQLLEDRRRAAEEARLEAIRRTAASYMEQRAEKIALFEGVEGAVLALPPGSAPDPRALRLDEALEAMGWLAKYRVPELPEHSREAVEAENRAVQQRASAVLLKTPRVFDAQRSERVGRMAVRARIGARESRLKILGGFALLGAGVSIPFIYKGVTGYGVLDSDADFGGFVGGLVAGFGTSLGVGFGGYFVVDGAKDLHWDREERATARRWEAQLAAEHAANLRAADDPALEPEFIAITGKKRMVWGNGARLERVTPSDYLLSKTEVTVAQYRACVDAGACTIPREGDTCTYFDPYSAFRPVNCVSRQQAQDYATWVGARLPTALELVYAGTGEGRGWRYAWGGRSPDDRLCRYSSFALRNDRDHPDASLCGLTLPAPVCSAPRGLSRSGLCDLTGNVQEFASDSYGAAYGASFRTYEDYFDTDLYKAKSGLKAKESTDFTGFRVARDP